MTPTWKPDPSGRHEYRYWDGVQWTDHVSDDGQVSTDAYNPADLPPPPPAGPPAPPQTSPVRQASYSYRLVLYDRKGAEVHSSPYQSPDSALRFAEDNPRLKVKQSLGNALLRGAFSDNVVTWKRAIIYQIDDSTGASAIYHQIEH